MPRTWLWSTMELTHLLWPVFMFDEARECWDDIEKSWADMRSKSLIEAIEA